ncbi:hypothetical protein AZI86_07150 [Bdellovibrio bacteriovorus]|uniref:Uncharacterized protein n=1 Tax=Bdellovibrio bacteriovorus TaxID=959 RepID=A0A150WR68_BDEBC|nr:hypothetical protein [Bdellovibrio bacteriovorus]KYG66807.1 hypothetical protein AZI86_07150 [Bdellovibrio bacteriovorus]
MKENEIKEVAKDAAIVGGTALAIEGLGFYSSKASSSNQATMAVLCVNAVLLYVTFKVGESSLLLLPGLFLPIIAAFFVAPRAFWCLFVGVIVCSSSSNLPFYYFEICYLVVALYDCGTSNVYFSSFARNWLLAAAQVAALYMAWNRDEILKFVGMAS